MSKEKYKLGSRPQGVIFDPDFDLYARKTNCFDLNDLPDQSDNLEETKAYGPNFPPTTPVLLPSSPSDTTPILLVEPSPSVMTTLQDETTHYVPPTTSYDEPSTIYTQGPPTTYEPSTQNIPSTSPANSNGDRLYFSQDIYPLYKYPTLYEPNYPAPNQEVYIPGGYAANAQEVEDRYRPTSYDSNVRPSPPTHYSGPPKPIFGLGYGNGYSYGQPESYNPNKPQDSGYASNSQRPSNVDRDPVRPSGYESNRDPNRLSTYDNDHRDRDPLRPASYDTRPDPGSSPPYGPRPNNDHNNRPLPQPLPYGSRPNDAPNTPAPYEPRPESSHSSPPPYGPPRPSSQRPGDYMDFTNRPDAPEGTARPSTYGPSGGGGANNNFDNNYMRRNGTAASRPGGYNDDKHINTYFNPDDYLMGNKSK